MILTRQLLQQKISLMEASIDDDTTEFAVYSLLCNWFRNAVLPADHELLADVMRERPGKRCAVCGKPVYSSSNRAKYCPACAKQERRKQDAKRKREQYWNLRK